MSGWVAVNASDIANRWQPLTPGQNAIAPTLIIDAQDILEKALEDLGILGAPSPQDLRWERTYVRVVATMAKRVLQNPEGFLSTAVTIDDFKQEYRRDKAVSEGSLYVSDAEVNDLIPRERQRRGAFSIRPGG